ncbi:MAG: rRNA maturation RNase YbeY [Gammaproteobacteria bacterium]|nr:rRNA maturation RNase YbeY [Gammaproteobacteria bacterium]
MIKLRILNYVNEEKYNTFMNKVAKSATEILKVEDNVYLNVVICDNEMIKDYNNRYRQIDRETDVLSFPSDEEGELGDILISLPKATLQAEEYGHSLKRELSFLLCHGILHCMGYDHMTKEEETVMFNLQEEILNHANIRREA